MFCYKVATIYVIFCQFDKTNSWSKLYQFRSIHDEVDILKTQFISLNQNGEIRCIQFEEVEEEEEEITDCIVFTSFQSKTCSFEREMIMR